MSSRLFFQFILVSSVVSCSFFSHSMDLSENIAGIAAINQTHIARAPYKSDFNSADKIDLSKSYRFEYSMSSKYPIDWHDLRNFTFDDLCSTDKDGNTLLHAVVKKFEEYPNKVVEGSFWGEKDITEQCRATVKFHNERCYKNITWLLSKGLNINAQNLRGETPLCCFLKSCPWSEIEEGRKFLLQAGAFTHSFDIDGRRTLDVSNKRLDREHLFAKYDTEQAETDTRNLDLILEEKRSLNYQDPFGRTPLHEAALQGKIAELNYLLEHGALVNCQDNRGWTPLHEAVFAKNVEAIRKLLEYSVITNLKDNLGRTALQLPQARAIENLTVLFNESRNTANNRLIKYIYTFEGREPTCLSNMYDLASFPYKSWLWHYFSADEAYKDHKRSLLKGEKLSTLQKVQAMKAILKAKFSSNYDSYQSLVATGLNTAIVNNTKSCFWGWGDQCTLTSDNNMLGKILMEIRFELLRREEALPMSVESLVSNCNKPLIQYKREFTTTEKGAKLINAAKGEDLVLIKLLLADSSVVDVNSCDAAGNTPLHHFVTRYYTPRIPEKEHAYWWNIRGVKAQEEKLQSLKSTNKEKRKIIELFLTKGANPNAQNLKGETPLFSLHKSWPIKLLCNNGSQLHAFDENGKIAGTYGFLSAKKEKIYNQQAAKDIRNLAAFMHGKRPITDTDPFGRTPMHEAIFQAHDDCLKYLLESDVDLDVQDNRGWTPLHEAVRWNNLKAAELLIKHGACKRIGDLKGQLPMDFTRRKGEYSYKKMRNILRSHADIEPYIELLDFQEDAVGSLQIEAPAASQSNEAPIFASAEAPSSSSSSSSSSEPFSDFVLGDFRMNSHESTQVQASAANSSSVALEDEPIMPDAAITEVVADHPNQIRLNTLFPEFFALHNTSTLAPCFQFKRARFYKCPYDAYFALYNAMSFFNPEEYPVHDRNKFINFFRRAITTVTRVYNQSPNDPVSAPIARSAIESVDKTVPVVFLTKSQIFNIAKQELSTEKAFADDLKSKKLLEQFNLGKIRSIAVVAGLGIDDGQQQWFTIFAERQDGLIIKVADCHRLTTEWNSTDYDLVMQRILPFYMALDNVLGVWPNIFHEALRKIIFSEFENQQKCCKLTSSLDDTTKAFVLRKALQEYCTSITSILHFMGAYELDRKYHESFDSRRMLISTVQLVHFLSLSATLSSKLRGIACFVDFQNPIGDELLALGELIWKKFDELMGNKDEEGQENLAGKLESVLKTAFADKKSHKDEFDRKIIQLRMLLIKSFCELGHQAEVLEEKIGQNPNILTRRTQSVEIDEFIENENALSDSLMRCILKYADKSIISTIGLLVKNSNIHPIRILFVGPPGNGKTTMAQAIAQSAERPFFSVNIAALGNSFAFSRQEQLKQLMDTISRNPTAVILLDELDAIKEHQNQPERTAECLQGLMDQAARDFPQCIFIATTNYPDMIPPALYSRFRSNILKIENPSNDLRNAIIDECCDQLMHKGLDVQISKGDKKSLVKHTQGFSIRDIKAIFDKASDNAHQIYGERVLQERGIILASQASTQPPVVDIHCLNEAYSAVKASLETPRSKFWQYLGPLKCLAAPAEILVKSAAGPEAAVAWDIGKFAFNVYQTHRQERMHAQEVQEDRLRHEQEVFDDMKLQWAYHDLGTLNQRGIVNKQYATQMMDNVRVIASIIAEQRKRTQSKL